MGSSREMIAEAINWIPGKKEKLRKALESLKSYSSLSNLTLDWKDFDDHFSAIEKSIDERLKALQEKEVEEEETEEEEEGGAPTATTPGGDDAAEAAAAAPAPAPRPELRSLCANMDYKGLRSYINDNRRKDLAAIREELAPAIRCAPEPALLILNAIGGFYYPNYSRAIRYRRPRNNKEAEIQGNRMTCINLLDSLHLISPEIKPAVRDKARMLALEWMTRIPKTGDSAVEALGFLQLIECYGLVPEFPQDLVMDLFVSISRKGQALYLIKSLRLDEKLHDLIEKLSSKGRQFDAVKFVYALNAVDKFPPIPLLRAYITDSRKMAHEIRKGNYSLQAKNEATAKELGALRSVLKAVEKHKLEAEYPPESLVQRIAQLEQEKADKKQTAADAAASSSMPQQQQSNKRPRPSPSPSAPVIAADPYPPPIQTQPQLGLADRAPYTSVAGPYGLAATGSLYHLSGPSLSGTAMGHGGTLNPSESLVGTSSLYDRPVTYNGYPLSGRPSSYGSSLYP